MLRLLSWLRLLTAVVTVFVIGLICWMCIDLYMDGNTPQNLDANGLHLTSIYSTESVSERLHDLAAPLMGYLLLVVVTGSLNLSASSKLPESVPAISPENRLRLMKARSAVLPEAAYREERKRNRIKGAAILSLLACALVCLRYLLNEDHFHSWDLEVVIGNMLLFILPWVIAAFLIAIAASLLCKRSVIREMDFMKCSAEQRKPAVPTEKGSHVNMIRGILLVLSVTFIVLGVMNGGLYDVLVKAINICTECIGLG